MSDQIQSSFAQALLDRRQPVPAGLTAWNGPLPQRRFAVYRNNVVAGLIGALTTRFPITKKIVGDEFFAGMARAFIALHPPRSPLLLHYGDGLADFLEGFEPAASLPYLADIVRLESARGRAYHAADAMPLDPAGLAGLDGDALTDLVFVPHPATAIVRSVHPIVTIWAMNAGQIPLQPVENWIGEDAMIVRPHLDVLVLRLPPGGAAFASALLSGRTLGEAFVAALDDTPDFDLPNGLSSVLQSGAFSAGATNND